MCIVYSVYSVYAYTILENYKKSSSPIIISSLVHILCMYVCVCGVITPPGVVCSVPLIVYMSPLDDLMTRT